MDSPENADVLKIGMFLGRRRSGSMQWSQNCWPDLLAHIAIEGPRSALDGRERGKRSGSRDVVDEKEGFGRAAVRLDEVALFPAGVNNLDLSDSFVHSVIPRQEDG
jgi:hypothetical protein